jgi:hypothetical protein
MESKELTMICRRGALEEAFSQLPTMLVATDMKCLFFMFQVGFIVEADYRAPGEMGQGVSRLSWYPRVDRPRNLKT